MLMFGDEECYIGDSIVISNETCAAAVQAPVDMAIVITARTPTESDNFSFSVERIGSFKDICLRTTSCSSPDDVSAWCRSGAIKKDMGDTQKKIVLARGGGVCGHRHLWGGAFAFLQSVILDNKRRLGHVQAQFSSSCRCRNGYVVPCFLIGRVFYKRCT